MKRYLSNRGRSRHSNGRLSLIATLTLVAILSGILLYNTSERQKEQVLSSYCGDFGLYGMTLVLMKDSTFRFSYYGCSQSNGYVTGRWSQDGPTLKLAPEQPDDKLDVQYERTNQDLIPIGTSGGKFTSCEYDGGPSDQQPDDEKENIQHKTNEKLGNSTIVVDGNESAVTVERNNL